MQRVHHILVVDDDEDDFLILSEHLNDIRSKAFDITWAASFQQAQALLREQNFDICFFDYLLGVRTGLDLLEVAREMNIRTPIILLTGKLNQEVDHAAIRLGVADYLEKADLDAKKLERCIRYAIDRKEVLQALRESEEKYRCVFADSLDALCLLDAEGRFTDANHATLTLLASRLEGLIGRKMVNFFHETRQSELFLQKIQLGENIREFEAKIVSAGGEVFDCVLVCTCLRLPFEPDNFFYQCILHDVTRRKKMEQQILAAEKLAATGRFMRMLGHEIRNPLNNIDLAISQLSEENDNEELNYYIEVITRNSNRINQLLTALLQTTANPGQLVTSTIRLGDLIDRLLDSAADRLALKGIRTEKKLHADADRLLHADAEKLGIALLNILINGVEAIDKENGKITVELRSAKNEIGISIGDNGPGIPEEAKNQIFEPYFSRKTNGLGLGLASTLSIVQSHGGRIELDSQPGRGTTFTVWLPAVEQVGA